MKYLSRGSQHIAICPPVQCAVHVWKYIIADAYVYTCVTKLMSLEIITLSFD